MSKLNGLKIKVAGNSFTTSVKTKRKLVKKLVFKRGKWILLNKFHPLDFKIFAESSIPELIFVNPYSKEEFANAYDLIKYAINKPKILPVKIKLLKRSSIVEKNFNIPIAKIKPGNAYPIEKNELM